MGFREKKEHGARRSEPHHATPGSRSGFSLIELVLVVAVVGVVAGLGLPVRDLYLNSGKESETRQEMREISYAILRYHEDVQTFPESLWYLQVRPNLDGWLGPYISWGFTDARSGEDGFLRDAWGNPYILDVVSTSVMHLRSPGRNGADEGGRRDDLQYDIDVSQTRRDVTTRELRDINIAVDAYNAIHLPDTPLSTVWTDALAHLQADGYLPADAESTLKYTYDAWGQPYETFGPLVLEVVSAGSP